jgi:catechol 2,3-dioxygenase-like lactoylglutathione lyase family enzyme
VCLEAKKGIRDMQLRQVALVASDLESAIDDIRSVLGVAVAYRDPGVGTFGLENALFAIGGTFLEVVSPMKPDTTAGRLLERRNGDGGYMAIFEVDDLLAERRRVLDLGVRIAWEVTLDDAATIHLHPKDVGGAIVSLDSMVPPTTWKWAGPDWQDTLQMDVVSEITGIELQSDDSAAMATRWGEVLDRPRIDGPDGECWVQVDTGTVRFVKASDGRGDGLSGIDLRATDRERLLRQARERGLPVKGDGVTICGTQFRIVA